jgi:hypothetical protein
LEKVPGGGSWEERHGGGIYKKSPAEKQRPSLIFSKSDIGKYQEKVRVCFWLPSTSLNPIME